MDVIESVYMLLRRRLFDGEKQLHDKILQQQNKNKKKTKINERYKTINREKQKENEKKNTTTKAIGLMCTPCGPFSNDSIIVCEAIYFVCCCSKKNPIYISHR